MFELTPAQKSRIHLATLRALEPSSTWPPEDSESAKKHALADLHGMADRLPDPWSMASLLTLAEAIDLEVAGTVAGVAARLDMDALARDVGDRGVAVAAARLAGFWNDSEVWTNAASPAEVAGAEIVTFAPGWWHAYLTETAQEFMPIDA